MRRDVIDVVNEVVGVIDDMRFSCDPEYVDAKIMIGKNMHVLVSCNRGYGVGVRRSGCVSTRNKHSMYEDRYIDMDIATQRDYYYNFESPFTISLKEKRIIREGFRAKGFTVAVYRGSRALKGMELSHNMRNDIMDVLCWSGIN